MSLTIAPDLTGANVNNIIDISDLVARGLVDGATPVVAYGHRTTSGAETNYAVWPNGAYTIPPEAGVQLSIVSDDAQDSDGGTGINAVHVHYLDGNLDPASEIVTLSGLTPVTTVAEDVRFIQCVHIQTAGSGLAAAGEIVLSSGGVTYATIAAGENRCSSSFRMVPRSKRLFVTGAVGSSISGTAAARTEMALVASYIEDRSFVYPLILFPHMAIGMQDSALAAEFKGLPPFPAGTVVGVVHTSDKACSVAATWWGRYEGA
jgi:hypothetical protein